MTPVANDLVNPDCVMEAFGENQKDRIQRASGLVNTWRFEESGVCAQRGHEGSTLLLHSSPCTSLPLACS